MFHCGFMAPSTEITLCRRTCRRGNSALLPYRITRPGQCQADKPANAELVICDQTIDITYLSTNEGWLYLAGLKDLFTGEVVGYAMSQRMTRELVMQALIRAVAAKRPAAGLIHHSDRGSQYCAHDYQRLLTQFGMKASMSRKGNCYDNAPIESFWGTLKNELVHHRRFATRQQAKEEVSEYIEIFYNRQRSQARLGYLAPAVFCQQYYRNQLVA